MSILFYAAEDGSITERVSDLIKGLLPENRIEFIAGPDRLAKRLRDPRGEIDVALLLTASREGFLEVLSYRDFFHDIRLVLILPDRRADTIQKAHSLRPRFITYADGDFRDVLGVLKKMIVSGHLGRSHQQTGSAIQEGEGVWAFETQGRWT